jgi:hypothetical protein
MNYGWHEPNHASRALGLAVKALPAAWEDERTRKRRARRHGHRHPSPVSEETKKEGELTCARRLYATTPLHGATVTGDALNCEPQSITLAVENGADVLFQLKANQPTALQHAMDMAAKLPPLLPANPTNGRITGARNGGFTRSMR